MVINSKKTRKILEKLLIIFDYNICANYSDDYLNSLLEDEGIIRNKLKIYGVRKNALAFLKVREEFGTFDNYIWQFTDFKTLSSNLKSYKDAPSNIELSDKISKDMKKEDLLL